VDEKQSLLEALNTKTGHFLGVGVASSVWMTYLDLGIKVLSAFYLCLLIYSMIKNKNK